MRPWIPRTLTILTGLVMLDLIIQYLLGLWTNVYAPATFTANTSYPSLDWHYMNGDILFVLAVLMLVFAVLARDRRLVVPAIVSVVAIFFAGELGMAYVNSTPNPPLDSFGMGVLFLVAFMSTSALPMILRMRSRGPPAPPPTSAPSNPAA